MTTAETTTSAVAPSRRTPSPSVATLTRCLLVSEWTKLRSVRSTYWTLAAAAAITIGLGALICWGFSSQWDKLDAGAKAAFNPITFSMSGLFLAQVAIGVLGVLVIGSEYRTGMIRSTFIATPQRRAVLAGKVAVFAPVTFVISFVSCLVAFFVVQAIFAQQGIQATINDPGAWRVIVGGGLILTIVGLLGLGLGALIRHIAGAIAALFALLFVLPILANFLPGTWSGDVSKYLPSNAGQQMLAVHGAPGTLPPWVGLGIFAAYAAASLVAAGLLLSRRDA